MRNILLSISSLALAASFELHPSFSHKFLSDSVDPSKYLQNLTNDGYPMFLVPKNLLLNLTTFSLNLTTPTAHDSYAFSTDYNVYWLHNVSTSSNYEWWDRLDFNS